MKGEGPSCAEPEGGVSVFRRGGGRSRQRPLLSDAHARSTMNLIMIGVFARRTLSYRILSYRQGGFRFVVSCHALRREVA